MSSSNQFNKELVEHLLALDALTFSILPTVIAFLLADGLTPSEQGVVSSFISDIGDELAGIALYINAKNRSEEAAAEECKQECEKIRLILADLLQENHKLQNRIAYLENKIKTL